MTKERPILFSGPMVRALLAGTKTQTRRVMRPEHVGCFFADAQASGHDLCPYGQPGDRLWVRETWRVSTSGRHYSSGQTTVYVTWREEERGLRRGFQHQSKWTMTDAESDAFMLKAHGPGGVDAWRPSIHMPRWASRLTLEVTEVRVQRLQEISEEDARAEGVQPVVSEHWTAYDPETDGYPSFGVEPDAEMIARRRLENVRHRGPTLLSSARSQFQLLWDSINGERSPWSKNDWVWCVSFRVVP